MENKFNNENLLDICKESTENGGLTTDRRHNSVVYEEDDELAYDVDERPPWFVVITTAFQHLIMCIGSVLTIITVLGDLVCSDVNDPVRAVLFSSSVLIIGMSTSAQSLLGLRLPVFQGASSTFLIPLFALKTSESWKCTSPQIVTSVNNTMNYTDNATSNIVYDRLAELQGSLIAASIFEVVIGMTGMIGVLMKFISPITIGVTIFCLGYSLYPIVILLCNPHWGISMIGCLFIIILSVYMSHITIPLPSCTQRSKMKSKPFPVFQVFPVLLTLVIMWILCIICTNAGLFSDDIKHPSFRARTDIRTDIINRAPWILIPYPGQFGIPRFNTAVFVGFVICVMISIVESVGDYIATAHICKASPIPRHALNRGIAVEGICSVLSGAFGSAHATTSYSTTVSLVGLTKITSRIVLVVSGILACIFSIFGKFGAFLTSVPDPVLGGILLAFLGVLCSQGISAFRSAQLQSSRNLSIIGISIYCAICLSEWQRQFPDSLKTDFDQVNQLVHVTLGNAMFMGFIMSIILDNTVKGTDRERGILKTDSPNAHDVKEQHEEYAQSRQKLFDLPLVPILQKKYKLCRRIPFFQPFKIFSDTSDMVA